MARESIDKRADHGPDEIAFERGDRRLGGRFIQGPRPFGDIRPGHPEPSGKGDLLKAAKLLAMNAYDFLASAELREKVKRAFEQKR